MSVLIITALASELKQTELPKGVALVYCGVGKINAAVATLQAIQTHLPRLIINFGTAGKINKDLDGLLEIGRVIQRDMTAEPLAPRGHTPFGTRPYDYHAVSGHYVCGTGDSFVTAHDPWLVNHHVDVVDMELFAIAAVAHQLGIPWRAFKYITDDANDSAGDHWQDRVSHGHDLFLDKLNELI